jgi:hypothetical protein
MLIAAEPAAFKPAAGAWGRRGSTHVRLAAVDAPHPAQRAHHGLAQRGAEGAGGEASGVMATAQLR